jgi:hypothetical protein
MPDLWTVFLGVYFSLAFLSVYFVWSFFASPLCKYDTNPVTRERYGALAMTEYRGYRKYCAYLIAFFLGPWKICGVLWLWASFGIAYLQMIGADMTKELPQWR